MHICKECWTEEQNGWCTEMAAALRSSCLCFDCHFWHEKIAWAGDEAMRHRAARVDGTHYLIEPEVGVVFRGYGGSKFVVQFNDGTKVETRNMWCQGDIPQRFRARLPNNAVFL